LAHLPVGCVRGGSMCNLGVHCQLVSALCFCVRHRAGILHLLFTVVNNYFHLTRIILLTQVNAGVIVSSMATELFTIPEAARYFGISRQRLWKLVDEGRIKAQRMGQQWFIKERDLLKAEWKSAGRPPKK
jgi:excisionase family DNA binding protein